MATRKAETEVRWPSRRVASAKWAFDGMRTSEDESLFKREAKASGSTNIPYVELFLFLLKPLFCSQRGFSENRVRTVAQRCIRAKSSLGRSARARATAQR